ncbi:vegetative incompatibility protein HET-E-1 [Trichophaea hybrida]|nr:vegetative incompatibility protein HET-E-1 [Trichophaea hybrida]
MDPLSLTASIIAVVQISKEILTLCGKYAADVKDAKADIESLTSEVTAFHDVLNKVKDLAEGPNAAELPTLNTLIPTIEHSLSELKDLKTRLNPGKRRKAMKRVGLGALKWPFKSGDVNKFIEALERSKTTISVAFNTDQCQILMRVGGDVEQLAQDFAHAREDNKAENEFQKQDQQLSKLPFAEGATFNSRLREHESQCLPDTRVDLLQQIISWSEDPNSACIFWLNGVAGTGKSTIARTVARTWASKDRLQLGASFFFSKGRGDVGHASKFFTTIAAQLAVALPAIMPSICAAIVENPDIFQRGLGEQWKYLIFQPLCNFQRSDDDVSTKLQVVILVIDALDECDGDEDTRLILRVFAEAKNLKTVRLLIFITSRPETPIRFGFHAIPDAEHQDFVLHNISQSIIEHDISVFLRHELDIIGKENCFGDEWPGESTVEKLCKRARGLFIYASTACRFIRDPLWDPKESLALILKDDYVGQSPTQELDEIYTRILTHSITLGDRRKRNKELLSSEFKQIVGSIVILYDSLPAKKLAMLLGVSPGTVSVRLRCLHSVLDVPESDETAPVKLLHPSFRDFLLNGERCLDRQLWIDDRNANEHLFVSSLNLMSKRLHKDMCNLRLPGTLTSEVESSVVQDCIPLDIQYACRYWVYHLERSNVELCVNASDRVHEFLQKHFLHWLETLSLIGKMSDAVLMVKSLERIFMSKSDVSQGLQPIIYDAKRFVLNNRSIIETAPLQTYLSAILFSPRNSIIRCQFELEDQSCHRIKILPEVRKDWNPSLQSLEGHTESVNAVAYSPSGHILASASNDKNIALWDPSTGALRGTLVGHTEGVTAVAFSPCGKLLASASRDCTIRLWDPAAEILCGVHKQHQKIVRAVTFSSDGQLFASGSDDCSVKLWDILSGDLQLRCTLNGHSDWVRTVAFSPDGKLLATGSDDKSVKLWDVLSGELRCTLWGHSDYVMAVAFSPDTQLLASGSRDHKLMLWDPSSGDLLITLEGHSSSVQAVTFSPDGQLLATSSADNTVRIWVTSSKALRSTFEGHSSAVNAVTFSPNGQLLASASDDKTVRLWDPLADASSGHSERHSQLVSDVAFSPDGRHLASASYDNSVRIWNPLTGNSRCLEGHTGLVNAMVYSLDGQQLASASNDNTVRIWNLATGDSICLTGHSSSVEAVAYSPDGQSLASGSSDRTVRILNLSTGDSRSLEGHSNWVRAVTFSPDGECVASASVDRTVRLWDPSTGTSRTLKGHSGYVWAVAFSPDGLLLASASRDKTVRIWDIKTEETIQKIDIPNRVTKLSFSSDGSYLDTNQGILMLPNRGSQSQSKSIARALGLAGDWVRYGTQNILWLPPDYRAICQAARQNLIAIGHGSGGVTFIEFDLDHVTRVLLPKNIG